MIKQYKTTVSIIMPAYNAELHIEQAIQSIMNQNYDEWELIIINDGSTDNTKEIIENFNDPRIVLLSQKNSGVSSARNKGLEIVKGEYITFLDADDILPQQSLQKRVVYMNNNPNVDLVDGHVSVRDINLENEIRHYTPYYNGSLLPRLLKLDDKVFLGICYLFRSNLLKSIQFSENMTHSEDLLFYIKLSSVNNIKYAFVEDTVYWYRNGSYSAMGNLTGLENGYLQLIQEVRKLKNISKADIFMIKTKIVKIMFLSWLNQKKIVNAIKSIFYIYEIVLKDKNDRKIQTS